MVSYSTKEPPNWVIADDGPEPLFEQIARSIADDVLSGALNEGDRVPSINEIAAFHGINPATANRGINALVAQGIVEKRRGIGMFVAPGAREALLDRRRRTFIAAHVSPLLAEAHRLGLTRDDLIAFIDKEYRL